MKKITLSLCALAISFIAISQQNPCPTVTSQGFNLVPNGDGTCSINVILTASGDVGADKSINIKVYEGLSTTGNLLSEDCIVIPGRTESSPYASSILSLPCNTELTAVISRSTNAICGGTICSDTIRLDAGPLPIALTNFFASRSKGAVTLTWKTESEINAQAFVIQRNTGGTFVDIATVAAKNSATGSTYTFVDNNNSAKAVTQYRLKMVDVDGAFKNSDIKVVKGLGVAADFSIYPNPSNGAAKVSISDISGPTDVQLIDNTGRILKNILLTNTNTVDYNSLQKGMYMIRIINKTTGETLTKKLNVVN